MSATVLVIWGVVSVILMGMLVATKGGSSPVLRNLRVYVIFSLAPVVAFGILLGVVFSYSTLHFVRFAHAMCVLGLWLTCVLAFLTMTRRPKLLGFSVAAFVVALASAIYLTPVYRFEDAFAGMSLAYPLLLGLLLIAMFYVGLFRIPKRSEIVS